MGMFKGAMKTGVAMKILDVVRREAAKPQNQAKARQLFERVTSRSSTHGGRAPRSRFAGTRRAGRGWTNGH